MTKSKIEWTDRSDWNPVRGCTRASEGCGSARGGGCYAEILAARFSYPAQGDKPAGWGHGFAHMVDLPDGGRDHRWTGKVEVQWDRLDLPLGWRMPAKIFASSTSDLFHEKLPWQDIATIYGTAIAAHHLHGHTIQILTKRGDRMRELLHLEDFWDVTNAHASMLIMDRVDPLERRTDDARATCETYDPETPPPGIWLGVSVEDRPNMLSRAADLAATPAAVRWWSAEPLIGDLGAIPPELMPDWVVCGGESGPGARDNGFRDNARALLRQCQAAGVPFFGKQDFKKRELPEDLAVREMPCAWAGREAS